MSNQPPVVIKTIGKADLHEDLIFEHTSGKLQMGDLVDLRVAKPADAPVYGQARVSGYEGFIGGYPVKFKAIRIV
jgi:hypothetical protein